MPSIQLLVSGMMTELPILLVYEPFCMLRLFCGVSANVGITSLFYNA